MMLLYERPLTMESRAPRVGHKKSRNGCAQCKRRHVKVSSAATTLDAKTDLVRSAMKPDRAQTVFDMVWLVVLLAGLMCLEKISKLREAQPIPQHQHRGRNRQQIQMCCLV